MDLFRREQCPNNSQFPFGVDILQAIVNLEVNHFLNTLTSLKISGLDPTMNLQDFQKLLETTTGISSESQILKLGYPPRRVQV